MDFYGGFTVVDIIFDRFSRIFRHFTVIFDKILSKFGPNLTARTSKMADFRPFLGGFLSFSRKFSKKRKNPKQWRFRYDRGEAFAYGPADFRDTVGPRRALLLIDKNIKST